MSEPVVIIGAGLAGLALAWHLRERGRDVVVVEASDRVGGVIRTHVEGGVRMEQGPQSLRAGGPATALLLEGVGLKDRLVAASEASKKRYLLLDGALQALPSGPGALLGSKAMPLSAVLRAMAEPLQGRSHEPGESIASFVRRRFGPWLAEPLLDAFIAGIYAGDATKVEAEAAFPALVEAEREHGSVVLGMMRRKKAERPEWLPRGSFTFDTGVEALPRALEAALGDSVRLGTPARRVASRGEGFRVFLDEGPLDAARVVVTAPPWVAAGLLPEHADVLSEIPASPVAAVHLAWPEGQGPRQQGFGWLAPTRERTDVLGCIWVSSTFPHLAPEHDVVRVMLAGSRKPELAALSRPELVEHALAIVREVQGDVPEPALTQVAIHEPGIPQYVAGHTVRRRALEAIEGLHVLGWGVTGIGLAQGLDAALELAELIEPRALPTPSR